MTDEPKRLDVLATELADHLIDDAVQIFVIRFRHPAPCRLIRQSGRRRNDEAILLFEIERGEVRTLPVADRPGAVQIENERNLLAFLQIAREVEEVFTSALLLGRSAEES